ncbi:MAG: LPXTG cell wall anchor domain-containing protein [Patescibacteria group bacterium]
MYGKPLGVSTVAGGIALLPSTGDSRSLFFVAAGLLVSGVVIFAAATILARKNRRSEAN